jgi:hypothetical protein
VNTTRVRADYDPVLKRYRAVCSVCAYVAVRARRDAAEHALEQHLAYAHGLNAERAEATS